VGWLADNRPGPQNSPLTKTALFVSMGLGIGCGYVSATLDRKMVKSFIGYFVTLYLAWSNLIREVSTFPLQLPSATPATSLRNILSSQFLFRMLRSLLQSLETPFRCPSST